MKIYLAANYGMNAQMRAFAGILAQHGHECICEWINGTHGGDDKTAYALIALIDLRNLDQCEAMIFFSESPEGSRTRGEKHVEFGYAIAKGKRVFIVGPCVNVFHHLPQVIQRMHFEDVLHLLQSANAAKPQPTNER